MLNTKNIHDDPTGQVLGGSRSYAVHRTFGKDITHKVLNSSGAAVIQNQITNVK